MTAAPLLAALLRAALPGLRALDLGRPPALLPWLPGTLCGADDPEALPPAEAALLRRFRHPDGRPLFGFDPAADAALLAGASGAWGGDAPERLLSLAAPPSGLPGDVLLLVPADGAAPAAVPPRARILLLLGAGEAVERRDLLVPAARLDAVHGALRRAAEALAAGAAGGRWLARAGAIADGMASVALLPEEAQTHRPPLTVPAAALVHDAPVPAGPDGLGLPEAGRVRVLVGAPPPGRVRVVLRGEGAARAALFGDGRRLPAMIAGYEAGETRLDAGTWPAGAGAAVLGVAVPAPARAAALVRVELLP